VVNRESDEAAGDGSYPIVALQAADLVTQVQKQKAMIKLMRL
jgi:hypothetical protein